MRSRIVKLRDKAQERWKLCDLLKAPGPEQLRRKAYWEGVRDAYDSAIRIFDEEIEVSVPAVRAKR